MSNAYKIGIIVFDEVLTSEVIGPAEVFAVAGEYDWFAGSEVLLIGVEPSATIRTAEGITLTVNATIADDPSLDVLFVPGSNDVSDLLQHAGLNAFIRKQEQHADWIGSACAGAFLLGNAGVLDGHQATTWFGGEDSLQAQFPTIEVVHDRPVVVDRRRVTANGGIVSYQAAITLLGEMCGAAQAKRVYNALSMGRLNTWDEIEASINTPV